MIKAVSFAEWDSFLLKMTKNELKEPLSCLIINFSNNNHPVIRVSAKAKKALHF